MLTLKTSIAAAIVVGALAATAGITYTVTKTTIAVGCPAPTIMAPMPSGQSALPPGNPAQPYHGKQW
jgi:hypothetical protein